jgi:hypothetical protein
MKHTPKQNQTFFVEVIYTLQELLALKQLILLFLPVVLSNRTTAQEYQYVPFPDSNTVWSEVYWKPYFDPSGSWGQYYKYKWRNYFFKLPGTACTKNQFQHQLILRVTSSYRPIKIFIRLTPIIL